MWRRINITQAGLYEDIKSKRYNKAIQSLQFLDRT